MNITKKLFCASALTSLSTIAAAHPGHDQALWMNEPVHLLTTLSVGVVVLALVWFKSSSKQNKISSSTVNKD